MAIFRAYAKVLEPNDPALRIYEAGLSLCPGQPGQVLADVLRRTGGVYETTTPLLPQFRDDIREVAELTSDAELLAIADMTEVPVSLEHLRGLDPETRIVIRTELRYEGDESARLNRTWDHRPALATVMPDGTVIAGDAFPAPPATASLAAERGAVGRRADAAASSGCRRRLRPCAPGKTRDHDAVCRRRMSARSSSARSGRSCAGWLACLGVRWPSRGACLPQAGM